MSNGARALARRVARITPFQVVRVFERARALERAGREIVHLEVGEPDFSSAPSVIEAGVAALHAGCTGYTETLGLPALRQAIAMRYPASVDAGRVAVTTGASAALNLLAQTLIDPGQEVLLPDPGYPCNEVFVRAAGGVPRAVPVDATSGFQLTPRLVEAAWGERTAAVLLASPANPTGAMLAAADIETIVKFATRAGGVVIVDEIYQGLVYDHGPAESGVRSALAQDDRVFVVNSFSKYFGMTGWRVGWLVAPRWAMEGVARCAENLYLAPPTVSQHAALAALRPEAMAEHERRRRVFARRRDLFLAGLESLGVPVAHRPQGAFYVYADISRTGLGAERFCERLLEDFGVAATPGTDFGAYRADQHVRFAFTVAEEQLRLGLQRLGEAYRSLRRES